MNLKKIIIASALITIAASAFAGRNYPPEPPFVSTKTRAEVIAEIGQGDRDLMRSYYSDGFHPHPPIVSGKTRAEVIAELEDNGGSPLLDINTYGGP